MNLKEIAKILCEGLRDFGSSMTDLSEELNEDFRKQDKERNSRAIKDKKNLDMIWGKRK